MIEYLGYGCIIAAGALLWLGWPDRAGEPARWLRWSAALPLFPVFLMALFVGGIMLVVGPDSAGFISPEISN